MEELCVGELLTAKEVSKLSGISETRLLELDTYGKFKSHKVINGEHYYTLQGTRNYLADYDKLKKGHNTKEEILEKWREHLSPDGRYLDNYEKHTLAILLDNAFLANTVCTFENNLSPEQIIWLVQQSWIRSKFKKMVNIQPVLGPAAMVYWGNPIQDDCVSATTQKYATGLFKKGNFEQLKDTYANAIAEEIDLYIFRNLHKLNKCSIESILDCATQGSFRLSDNYNYIIAPKTQINALRNLNSCQGVHLFEIEAMLDPDSFSVMAVAGKYPHTFFDLPIFAPYVLINQLPTISGIIGLAMRAGWFNGKEPKQPQAAEVLTSTD